MVFCVCLMFLVGSSLLSGTLRSGPRLKFRRCERECVCLGTRVAVWGETIGINYLFLSVVRGAVAGPHLWSRDARKSTVPQATPSQLTTAKAVAMATTPLPAPPIRAFGVVMLQVSRRPVADVVAICRRGRPKFRGQLQKYSV